MFTINSKQKSNVSRKVKSVGYGVLVALVAGTFAWPVFARAQDSNLDVAVGVGGVALPRYEGSNRHRVMPVPIFDITWHDSIFLNLSKGLGIYVLNDENLQLGVAINYDALGRRERHDRRNLDGLGNIDRAAQGQIFADYQLAGVMLSAAFSHYLGGSDGTLIDVSASRTFPLSPRLFLTPTVGATWADDNYMSAYFGISPSQSQASGLEEHSAEAGFKNVTVGINTTYMLTPSWTATVTASAAYLLGDAADSPVTREEVQPLVMFGLTRRF